MKDWAQKSFYIICIVVIVGMFVNWIVRTVEKERSIVPEDILIMEKNSDYGEIYIYMDRFDLASKEMHAFFHFTPGEKLEAYASYLYSGNATDRLKDIIIQTNPPDYSTWTGPLVPIFASENMAVYHQRWMLEGSVVWNEVEAEIRFAGSDSAFPFDRYRQFIMFIIYPPKGVTVEEGRSFEGFVPVQLRVVDKARGYTLSLDTGWAGLNNMLGIWINRSLLATVEIMLIWFVLTILSVLVLIRACRMRKGRDIVGISIGVVGLMIGIPAMRFAVVPPEIQSFTVLDKLLLAPLVISLLAISYGGCRYVYKILFVRSVFDENWNE